MKRGLASLLVPAIVAGACATGARPELTDIALAPSTTTTESAAATTTTTTITRFPSPSGRLYPIVPDSMAATTSRIVEVESLIHTIETADEAFADLAHEQQVLYRSIGRHPDWIGPLLARTPDEYVAIVEGHIAARQAIADISSGAAPLNVPAWEIIEPLPADQLRALYESAEADSGIHWSFLAAINLLETGYGRIDGLSTAGAQGPMQFLPTTWEEVSDGDIDDAHDAIPAAARYLVRRGGPDDMHNALLGYNNSIAYVAAVTHYANLFRDDPRSFLATHAWEIHYSSAAGDLWFPVGYRREESIPAVEHMVEAPWSAPPLAS